MARKAKGTRFTVDPVYEELDIWADDQELTLDIWRSKYKYGDEEHPFDSYRRVVEGVYAKDNNAEAKREALEAMQKGLWIPAGRIQAGAGTPNIVTLLNCYMCQDIDDSMNGIADALKESMLTMQQGGGIGMNFGTLRPSGSFLRRTGAVASGPIPFMNMWDSMCETIMSAGSRRGAMMAVMNDEHPDLIDFITAKHEKGKLTNFNMSVLISDAFMEAVKEDEEWFLGFNVPRADGQHLFVTERENGNQIEQWYAYSKWQARELWQMILGNTYEWSEPGVVFIDRVNRQNNLQYCETITGTNPCGEQPLPPHGCCNLGAVNLARMVTDPFTPNAAFNYGLLEDIAAIGTRFLDNVIDVTLYPLETQTKEEVAKRRIGIGITGLANCLAMLSLRYGDEQAIATTSEIMNILANAVYSTSALLAEERGTFPLYDKTRWGRTGLVDRLQKETQGRIQAHGIRNGVLLTIAPTGTTSLAAGNLSSGLEPVFLHKVQRNVRQTDNTFKPYTAYDYGYRLYCHVHKINPDLNPFEMPQYMPTHVDLNVMDHIRTQSICQRYIDASVSKTINCPKELTFEEFEGLYLWAYEHGCKGCTSYRPSDVRGSILQSPDEDEKPAIELLHRPDVLPGSTYKVRWPSVDENYYITINDVAGVPFEVFIQSTSSMYSDWTTALGLMISAIMRKGGDISFIPTELAKVRSADDVGWVDGVKYSSLVALIGHTIGKHLNNGDSSSVDEEPSEVGPVESSNPKIQISMHSTAITDIGEICPQCNQSTVIFSEGCKKCINCTYSNCG